MVNQLNYHVINNFNLDKEVNSSQSNQKNNLNLQNNQLRQHY
jgi:hypothetical protein